MLKTLFRAAFVFLALVGVLVFLYGAMQLARAQQAASPIVLGEGLQAVIESPAREAATRALTTSAVLVGASVLGLLATGRRRRRKPARAAR